MKWEKFGGPPKELQGPRVEKHWYKQQKIHKYNIIKKYSQSADLSAESSSSSSFRFRPCLSFERFRLPCSSAELSDMKSLKATEKVKSKIVNFYAQYSSPMVSNTRPVGHIWLVRGSNVARKPQIKN